MSVDPQHSERPQLFDRTSLPAWLAERPWRWVTHTTVLGSSSPDGRCVEYPRDGGAPRHFELDLVCVDAVGAYDVAPLSDREAAHLCWEAGVVALSAPGTRGAATLLVPGSVCTPELVVDSFRRLAHLLGADPLLVSVELPLYHPRDHSAAPPSPSARIVLDALPERDHARHLVTERYGLALP